MAVAGGTARRSPRRSRRWIVVAVAAFAGLVAVVVIALAVVYPRVGAWMIRDKLGAKVAKKLGRDVTFGQIDVSLGHAVLRDVDLRGPLDGDTPLVHIDRIDVDFDAWASLVGTVRVHAVALDGVVAMLRRDGEGRDNVRDVIDRVRGDGAATTTAASDGGLGALRPERITLAHVRLFANDELTGTTAVVGDGDATWTAEGLVAHARGVTATTTAAPSAAAQSVEIRKPAGKPPVFAIDGGAVELWTNMALSGIGGEIVARRDRPGHYAIQLAGGYGGVPGRLWTASGDFDPQTVGASFDLEAAKFQLDRLRPILEHSAIVDYQQTSVDTTVHVDVDRAGARFEGGFHLRGLNVGHPKISDKEVRDLDLSGKIAGSFDRASRKLELVRGDFVARDIPFSVTGTVVAGRRAAAEQPAKLADGRPAAAGQCRALRSLQSANVRLVIPPVDCQRVLVGIPKEIVPYLAGYRLRGMFDTDVHVDVDLDDLEHTKLEGHVGLNHCRVVDEPADSPKRLKRDFEHYVEVEKGQWLKFDVGVDNPDYVPFDQISPYVVRSIMSTEDSAFYYHHGFIPSEFQHALVTNLASCEFSYGASSITMQLVKNVLLTPEKTIARKLQELFLTWHVENTLSKDRILEIYLNVIEYGPGLYGIGPAARHYFGKAAKDLNPVEAAFFSSILPDPKSRYRQYCQGTLTRWTSGKIERILAIMHKRDRLTQEEYDQALATPLQFIKDGHETEDECMKRVTKALKNRRPTNPQSPKFEPPTKQKRHGSKR